MFIMTMNSPRDDEFPWQLFESIHDNASAKISSIIHTIIYFK